jgi:Mn-dependent DtxR family transcriptional regulator
MELQSGKVRSIDIATALKVSRASVNKALGRLKKEGFVLHDNYTAITITEKGRAFGDELIRRYNLARKILESVSPEDRIDEESCSMEHAVSVGTLERIWQRLTGGDGAIQPNQIPGIPVRRKGRKAESARANDALARL